MKRILSIVAMLSMAASMTVFAQEPKEPEIFVDERLLVFDDQGPIIDNGTGRTLIPMRFPLEVAGSYVKWDGGTQTITVDSSDNRNRAVLTVGSKEMKVYFYPSILEVVSDTVILDQEPVIVNDRTLVPIRPVLEAVGAKVDWDEEKRIVNVTSRAYSRFMRYNKIPGYEVVYPLSNGVTPFDVPTYRESEEPYDPKKELPTLSLTSETVKAEAGEKVDVYLNLSNVSAIDPEIILVELVTTLNYDKDRLAFDKYILLNDGEAYSPLKDGVNAEYGKAVKVASIASLGGEGAKPIKDGAIAKFTFTVKETGATEVSLSASVNSSAKDDNILTLQLKGNNLSLAHVMDLCVDTAPVVINAD